MSTWLALDPLFHPMGLGFLPTSCDDGDKRPVKEQLEERYAHGGGYRPLKGLKFDGKTLSCASPATRPTSPLRALSLGLRR